MKARKKLKDYNGTRFFWWSSVLKWIESKLQSWEFFETNLDTLRRLQKEINAKDVFMSTKAVLQKKAFGSHKCNDYKQNELIFKSKGKQWLQKLCFKK